MLETKGGIILEHLRAHLSSQLNWGIANTGVYIGTEFPGINDGVSGGKKKLRGE